MAVLCGCLLLRFQNPRKRCVATYNGCATFVLYIYIYIFSILFVGGMGSIFSILFFEFSLYHYLRFISLYSCVCRVILACACRISWSDYLPIIQQIGIVINKPSMVSEYYGTNQPINGSLLPVSMGA